MDVLGVIWGVDGATLGVAAESESLPAVALPPPRSRHCECCMPSQEKRKGDVKSHLDKLIGHKRYGLQMMEVDILRGGGSHD